MPFFEFFQFVQSTGNVQNPLFQPNFLNVEFFFNLVPHLLEILANLFGNTPSVDTSKYQWLLALLALLLWIALFAFIVGIIYTIIKIRHEIKEQHIRFAERRETALANIAAKEENTRWRKILDQMSSQNESDWRLAILEADNILGDLLERMEYQGQSIGDKLKGIELSDFNTLSQAWEAHKVRNQIAHEGLGVVLTKREADHVIDLYRQVFEEFHYI